MPNDRSVGVVLALALSAAAAPLPDHAASAGPASAGPASASQGNPAPAPGPLGFGSLGNSKEPITVTSDNLEYDYKANVVVYRGRVEVIQGNVKLKSDTLNITLQNQKQGDNGPGKGKAKGDVANGDAAASDPAPPAADPPAAGRPAITAPTDTGRVQEIVALGNVRIDQDTRWAVGGRAVFDQSKRTLVLTENPVLHDGPNQVVGDRVVVYLDENRSVVEGGQKRVKAVLYPNEKNTAPGPPKAGTKAAGAPAPGAGVP